MAGFWQRNDVRIGGITALIGCALAVATFGMDVWERLRPDPPTPMISPEGLPADAEITLTLAGWTAQQQALRARLTAQRDAAVAEERARYQEELLAVEARLATPQIAYHEALRRIADLERLLEAQTDIGADRITAAKAALANGDYSKADAIFAEVAAMEAAAVSRAAAAAYGRGEIAEAEVRWTDAAVYYARAARLDPTYDHLHAAREYAWRNGNYQAALRFGADLVALAETDPDLSDVDRATAYNEHALTLKAMGAYEAAEPLYRQAIEIGEPTLGTGHPDYAASLNNLAGLLWATGRYAEAEPLYREAMEIAGATLGTDHPDYAITLSNFARLLEATDRLDAAIPLYRQAVTIFKSSLGPEHPNTRTVQAHLDAALAEAD